VPDISEVNGWVPRLQKGEKREDIIKVFFKSEEYLKNSKIDISWFEDWLMFMK